MGRRLQLACLTLVATCCMVVEGKGGGGFGRSFGGGSRVRSSSSARTSGSGSVRARAPPSRTCTGCYYSGGMYYQRTYMFMYMGVAYPCTGCASRADADAESDSLTIEAVQARTEVTFSDVPRNSSAAADLLAPGSTVRAAWVAELQNWVAATPLGGSVAASAVVVAVDDTGPDTSALALARRSVHLTVMLESGTTSAAAVDAKLQRWCEDLAVSDPETAVMAGWYGPTGACTINRPLVTMHD